MCLLVACGGPPPIPEPTPIPEALRHLNLDPQPGTRLKYFFVYDDNVSITPEGSGSGESVQLFPLDGTASGEAYRATRVAVGKLFRPFLRKSYWVQAVECHGTMEIEPAGARIDLEGAPPCDTAHGVFKARRPATTPTGEAATAKSDLCRRYRDCTCALATLAKKAPASAPLGKMEGALSKNCSDAESLLITAVPDNDACTTGLTMNRSLFKELAGEHLAIPPSCAE